MFQQKETYFLPAKLIICYRWINFHVARHLLLYSGCCKSRIPGQQQKTPFLHMKIMIVEKDPEFREHLVLRLEDEGIDISGAGTLEEAEILIRENRFDGIVLGLSGFGRSSLNLMEFISTDIPGLKVVLINRHNKIPLSIEAMNLGACAEISVPVDIAALVKTLRRYCAESAQ